MNTQTKSKHATKSPNHHIAFTWKERERIAKRLQSAGLGYIGHRVMFQQSNAGGIVGECAKWALATVQALELANEAQCTFEWTPDSQADASFIETWSPAERERWNRSEHEAFGCILRSPDGDVLESLWGIFDPSDEYRKVVEGELALQASGPIAGLLESDE